MLNLHTTKVLYTGVVVNISRNEAEKGIFLELFDLLRSFYAIVVSCFHRVWVLFKMKVLSET
jgi:hypothetical protein